jgi:hypothetical protein
MDQVLSGGFEPLAGVVNEPICTAWLTDLEKLLKLHPRVELLHLTRAPDPVRQRRVVVECRKVVEVDRGRFAAALLALREFGRRFWIVTVLEVGESEHEAYEPEIRQLLRCIECIDGRWILAGADRDLAFDQFAIRAALAGSRPARAVAIARASSMRPAA